MAEVILINLHQKGEPDYTVPPGILYIGSYVQENGFSVKVLNFKVGNDKKLDESDIEIIKKELKDCLCVGFSVMTLQVPKSLEVSKLIKKLKPCVKIAWGGAHPTLFPEQTVRNANIDFVIMREGEQPFLELIKALKAKKQDFSKIKGLVFKNKGKIIQNPRQPMFAYFEKMMPNHELVEEFTRESMDLLLFGKPYKCVGVHTGRGCPYRCNFCINKMFYGNARINRSIDSIIREIKIVMKKFNPNLINLIDENFFTDKRRVEEFCDKLKKNNLDIAWITSSRVNYFDHFDDAFLKKLKNSGCIALLFGAESGSQKILNYIQKGITPEQTYTAAAKCVKHDIFPVFSIMIGFPNETKDDLLKTLDMMHRILNLSNRVGVTAVHILRPYPGSEVYNDCKKYGFDEPKSLEEWENKNKTYYSQYLNARHLKWIKDPETVEIISKYVPKGFNRYLISSDLNIIYKSLFKIRSELFIGLLYKYVQTDSKAVKNSIKACLELADNSSQAGKFILKKTIKQFSRL